MKSDRPKFWPAGNLWLAKEIEEDRKDATYRQHAKTGSGSRQIHVENTGENLPEKS